MKKKQLTLKDYEAHLASTCVAIVSGGIGGVYVKLSLMLLSWILSNPLKDSLIYLIAAAISGWFISWIVCKHAFPSAHHWYGHASWSHRIYDAVGIASGVLVYWLIR